jgi:transcriptional regulator with XRE-family HTH domain
MKLKELREENNLTQLEFAHFLHAKQNTYSQYKNEKRQLPIDILIKRANFSKYE